MTTYKHVLNKLTVLADPEHEGKHPLHDSRYIALEGTTFEQFPLNGENEDENGWSVENGGIVAKMTDCENQAAYARLFANSRELLHTLRSTTAWIRLNGGDCQTLDAFLSRFNDIA